MNCIMRAKPGGGCQCTVCGYTLAMDVDCESIRCRCVPLDSVERQIRELFGVRPCCSEKRRRWETRVQRWLDARSD